MAEKNKLSVDTDAVSAAVKEINTQLGVIESVRGYVAEKALAALEPVWSGAAKDAYAAELAAFAESMNNFAKSGTQLNAALDEAKKAYEAAERNALNKVTAMPR